MKARLFFFFYTLGIKIGNLFIYLGHFSSDKIRLMYDGRRSTLHKINRNQSDNGGYIWIHCASLGEFEQGRPLIEQIKINYPDQKILVSFFSPSGYEIRKNYPLADEIIYLPSDLPLNNSKLLNHYRPKILILIKYEFWWNLIDEVQRRNIPLYLISGVFREDDYFLSRWMTTCHRLLGRFNGIFVQDQQSFEVLTNHHIQHVILAGDTRIDRVLDNVKNTLIPDKIKDTIGEHQVVVYGSVWNEDMPIVVKIIDAFPDFIHIIAPHDIQTDNIRYLSTQIPQPSRLYTDEKLDTDVIIIDNIGMLSRLYSIASFVYIGGGFGKGIHNILEPTVYKLPVFFGPNHKKFNEAVALVDINAAFAVKNGEEMIHICQKLLSDMDYRQSVTNGIIQYFDQNQGATSKILRHLTKIFKPER